MRQKSQQGGRPECVYISTQTTQMRYVWSGNNSLEEIWKNKNGYIPWIQIEEIQLAVPWPGSHQFALCPNTAPSQAPSSGVAHTTAPQRGQNPPAQHRANTPLAPMSQAWALAPAETPKPINNRFGWEVAMM